jgi:hypothetical protein
VDDVEFDTTETPTEIARAHAFSIDRGIPGTQFHGSDKLEASAGWSKDEFRGVARSFLETDRLDATIRLRCSGSHFSLVFPPDLLTYWRPITGVVACRIDQNPWREFSPETAREVLIASGLSDGMHEIELRSAGAASSHWAIEGIRAWQNCPIAVSGKIDGGPLLTDLRAELTGAANFSFTLFVERSGAVSFLVFAAGRYELTLRAPGWEPARISFEASAGRVELPEIQLQPSPLSVAPVRELAADEPLVLIACGHCNTWGTEPAEWLSRRVDWINAQRPHALLVANEVNPAYVAGALRGLRCPWVITDGNHAHGAFHSSPASKLRELSLGRARIVTAGLDARGDAWREILSRFQSGDALRVVCSYEPFAPPELLAAANVRFYYYAHHLTQPPFWTRAAIAFLRKIDPQTFYRIEIGPAHTSDAPLKIRRFVFGRDL